MSSAALPTVVASAAGAPSPITYDVKYEAVPGSGGGGLVTGLAPSVVAPAPASVLAVNGPYKKQPDSAADLNEAILSYFQKRNYRRRQAAPSDMVIGGGAAGAGGVNSTFSLSQMALTQVLRNQASDNDVVTMSAQTLDSSASASPSSSSAETGYFRFKQWISESPERMKPELAQLLYPIFTHSYLELVLGGRKLEAHKFHKRHHLTFVGNAEFAQFIFLLTSISEPDDLGRDEVVSAFHAAKYSVSLSHKAFQHLQRFLQDCEEPMLIVQIFRSKIDLRVSSDATASSCSKAEATSQVRISKEEIKAAKEKEEAAEIHDVIARHTTSSAQQQQSYEVKHLKAVIHSVRESGTSSLPCTCLYKIFNDSTGTCAATVSKDATFLATGNEDSSVEVWDLLPAPSPTLPPPPNLASALPLGALSSGDLAEKEDDERTDETASRRNRTCSRKNRRILRGHSGPVYGVAFVPSGGGVGKSGQLVSVSGDKTMRLWDFEQGCNLAIYKGHSYPVWCLDVDRLGVNIATGSMDGTAKLWQLERTFPLRVYSGHESDVDVVRFHPNCNYLATASDDKTVRLWSHADAKMVRVFTGSRSSLHALAFSPDGKLLAGAGEDRKVRVWDLGSARLLKELRGHTDIVYSLAWHHNSKLLASSGMDGAVKLWDINESQQQQQLQNGEVSQQLPQLQQQDALLASYPTTCSNLIDLSYSPHNTLMAVGVAGGGGGGGTVTAGAIASNKTNGILSAAAAANASSSSSSLLQQQQQLLHGRLAGGGGGVGGSATGSGPTASKVIKIMNGSATVANAAVASAPLTNQRMF